MKKMSWIFIGALIVIIEMILWSTITGSQELLLLGLVNAGGLLVFLGSMVFTHYKDKFPGLSERCRVVAKFCKGLLREYGFVILSVVLGWKLLNLRMFDGQLFSVCFWGLIWFCCVRILYKDLAKKNVYRGSYLLTTVDLIILFGGIVSGVIVTRLRSIGNEKFFIAGLIGLLCVTILMLSQGNKLQHIIKSDRRIVFASIVGISLGWLLFSELTILASRNIREVESIRYQEKVRYMYVDKEESLPDFRGECGAGLCITSDGYCVMQPSNTQCVPQTYQGWECLNGRTQDGLTCNKK